MSGSYLYRYETKGIQKWILGGRQIRDLAGGSSLVEGLADTAAAWAKQAGAQAILQATAGAMTARFPDHASLKRFAASWPLALEDWAPGLRVVQAWVPESEGLEALQKRLAVRRNQLAAGGIEAGPWVLRTGRSGDPAVPHGIRSDARATLLDAAAVAKERAYDRSRRNPGPTTSGLGWDQFDIDVDDWPEASVSVIHADGMGIGKAIMGIARNPEALSRFSEALATVTSKALRAAIETLPRKDGRVLARPIVAAGDDLTYMVPASSARAFARTWLLAFREESAGKKDVFGGPLMAGAGIVTVHRHFPFAQAYEWAEELCKGAKEAARSGASTCAGVYAMQRITTALAGDVLDGTLGWCLADGAQAEVGSYDTLDILVEAVRGLPRGSLRRWLTAFENGRTAEARKLWDRGREVAHPEAWGRLERALRGVGAEPSDGTIKASGSRALLLRPGAIATPLRDALSLAHVEKGSRHES